MIWEDWSKAEPMRLAFYVTPDAMHWFDGKINHDDLSIRPNGLYQIVRAIYDALRESKEPINYAPEKYNYTLTQQKIRTPAEILGDPHEGTCLDLALLFCGLCLGHNLLPILIILDGHALAAVSLKNRLPEWDRNRPGRELFDVENSPEKGLLTARQLEQYKQFCQLVSDEVFLPIECTGFAHSQRLSQQQEPFPETVGRQDDGTLTFERSVQAGREQLYLEGRRSFQFALDIAMAQASTGRPYTLTDGAWARDQKNAVRFQANTRDISPGERLQLVNLLLACPAMKDRGARETVVNMLDGQISGAISRHATDRVDVLNIVTTCLNYPNGLKELVDAIGLLEGDSQPMQQLKAFVGTTAL